MSLASFAQSVQATDFATALRESEVMYPIIMSTHLAAIAVFGGMILMTDLRILGLAMRSVPITDVVGQLRPWKWGRIRHHGDLRDSAGRIQGRIVL